MREIREVYQQWLAGALAQEDALFAIGDILQRHPEAEMDGGEAMPDPAEASKQTA